MSVVWHRVDEVKPPEKRLLMVTGDSTYCTHKQFLTLAYYDEDYRPSRGGPLRWLSVQNDALTDQSWVPTHWAFPIELPETDSKSLAGLPLSELRD